ncbi:hypothetical protein K2X05_13425, partial [bacterium]|nr:hypothetical protein [bacterium]
MLRLFKYGILFLALAGVLTVIYFRFIKKPMPYEGWPIVQKHACVYGAYYFSYLFRSELDNSKINSECTQQVSSNSEVDKFKIGLFCGKGMALAYDRGQIDQSNFLKKGKDDLLSEDHAKTVELVR